MKHTKLIALGWLMLSINAQAASFDCAKAGTKVEHIICDTQEISKLDDELSAAYKAAQQDKTNVEKLKQAQKQWMKERNGCADAACVQSAYRKRVEQLNLTQNVAAQPRITQTGAVNAGTNSTVKKYPPYPDVWEMQFPLLANKQFPALRNVWLDNGDIWFGFISKEKTKKTLIEGIPLKEFTGITFFSRQTIVFSDANDEVGVGNDTKIKLINTSSKHYFPGTTELADNSYVISSNGSFDKGCYQGPGGNQLTRYQSIKTLRTLQPSKVAFLLLDEPITITTGATDGPNRAAACDAAEETITTRVVSISGEMLPLGEGGFLLVDRDYGWVIRFDSNLNTRSELLNKRLFVFDTELLNAHFINKVSGRNYRDAHGWTKMQEINDDLYAYLVKLSKGEK